MPRHPTRAPLLGTLALCATLTWPASLSGQGTLWRAGLNLGLWSFAKGGSGAAFRLGLNVGAEWERSLGSTALLLGLGYSQRRFGTSGGPITGSPFVINVPGSAYDFDYVEALALWRLRLSPRVALDLGPAVGRLSHCRFNGVTPCDDRFFSVPFIPNTLDYAAVLRVVVMRRDAARLAGWGVGLTRSLRSTDGGVITSTFGPNNTIVTTYSQEIQPLILNVFGLVRL